MESGQTIAGKYRLNQLLGTGGMASVWSATNVFTERQFAVKFMLPSIARTEDAARRFMMEAKASARINHPNIIEIIDVGQAEDGTLFLVMELLSGVSLETAMRRQTPPMTLYDFCLVMLDVGRALAAAHRSGVIHRDLKPTNIFLHKDRHGIAVPKLLDFGVSKFLEEGNHALTVAGTVLGSPLYMSPEQALGSSSIDGRTDVFAFGAILFEALVGSRAYDAPNFNALIVAIATKPPRQIDEAAPHLPESLRALVRECMVTDRNKRIATFDEVVDRLGLLVPYLEHDPARLPQSRVAGPLVDPDATNAMPALVRPSDHPPSMAGRGAMASSGVKTGTGPSGHYGAAWTPSFPPPGATTSPGIRAVGGGANVAVSVAAVLAVAVIASSAAYLLTSRRVQHDRPLTAAPTVPLPSATPSSIATTEPAAVNVDSLPMANGPHPQIARGAGRVSVAATPGSCTLFVDGVNQGSTPVLVDLPVGAHELRCEPPAGKPRHATLSVVDGVTTKYKFALD